MVKTLAFAVAAVLFGTAAPAAQAAVPSTVDPVTLRDELSVVAPPGSATRVDPVTKKVHMRIPLGATTQAVDAKLRRHAHQIVLERAPGGIDILSGIVGGHEIDGVLGGCTAGFMVHDGGAGRALLTAGHCTQAGGSWKRNGKLLGPSMLSVFGVDGDYGMVGVFFNFTAQPRVNSYISGSLNIQPVWGIQALPVPEVKLLCKMGRTTRYTCGKALAYDVTITLDSGVVVGGLIETNICAGRGDSGGPLWTSAFVSNPPAAYAVGLVSAGTVSIPCNDPSFRSYHQPVEEALAGSGSFLLTAV